MLSGIAAIGELRPGRFPGSSEVTFPGLLLLDR